MYMVYIVYLPETYLDSSAPIDDDHLQTRRYNSVRTDHQLNARLGGVLVY